MACTQQKITIEGTLQCHPQPYQRKAKVGSIKGFDGSPLEVGNVQGDGEVEVGDIKAFDKSAFKVGNLKGNGKTTIGDIKGFDNSGLTVGNIGD